MARLQFQAIILILSVILFMTGCSTNSQSRNHLNANAPTKNPEHLVTLAEFFEKQGKVSQAVSIYSHILTISPQHEIATNRLHALQNGEEALSDHNNIVGNRLNSELNSTAQGKTNSNSKDNNFVKTEKWRISSNLMRTEIKEPQDKIKTVDQNTTNLQQAAITGKYKLTIAEHKARINHQKAIQAKQQAVHIIQQNRVKNRLPNLDEPSFSPKIETKKLKVSTDHAVTPSTYIKSTKPITTTSHKQMTGQNKIGFFLSSQPSIIKQVSDNVDHVETADIACHSYPDDLNNDSGISKEDKTEKTYLEILAIINEPYSKQPEIKQINEPINDLNEPQLIVIPEIPILIDNSIETLKHENTSSIESKIDEIAFELENNTSQKEDSLESLLKALKSKNSHIRAMAALNLSEINHHHKLIIKELNIALKDKNIDVRIAADASLACVLTSQKKYSK